jgi:VanZ family protein
MKNRIAFKIAFWLWTVLLLTLTSVPKLKMPIEHVLNIDKLAHLGFYAIWALLFALMFHPRTWITVRKRLIILGMWVPLLDELHQIPIPGRMFSWWDLLADLIGIGLAILLLQVLFRAMPSLSSER